MYKRPAPAQKLSNLAAESEADKSEDISENTVNRIDTVNISIRLLYPDCFGKIPVLSCCLNCHSLVSDLCGAEDVNPGSAVQRDRQDSRTGLLSQDWERMLPGLAAGWVAR